MSSRWFGNQPFISGAVAIVLLGLSFRAEAQVPDRSRQYPSRSIGLAGTGRSFASSANAIFLNPATLGTTPQYLLGAGYILASGGETSHAFTAAWTDSTPNPYNLAMGIAYDFVDFETGSSQNVHGAVTYTVPLGGLAMSVGIGAHHFGGYGEVDSLTSGDAGLALALSQTFYLGVVGQNLIATEGEAPRTVGGGMAFFGGPFMIALDMSADLEVPVLTSTTGETENVVTWYGGLQFQMIPEAGFRAGIQYDATHEIFRAGGGLQFVLGRSVGLELGYMQNVDDGDDLRFGVNLDLYNPFGQPML